MRRKEKGGKIAQSDGTSHSPAEYGKQLKKSEKERFRKRESRGEDILLDDEQNDKSTIETKGDKKKKKSKARENAVENGGGVRAEEGSRGGAAADTGEKLLGNSSGVEAMAIKESEGKKRKKGGKRKSSLAAETDEAAAMAGEEDEPIDETRAGSGKMDSELKAKKRRKEEKETEREKEGRELVAGGTVAAGTGGVGGAKTSTTAGSQGAREDASQSVPGRERGPGSGSGAGLGAGSGSGRSYTVSIAVSGAVIDNAQSLELATALAGQIGRAAAIFQVDEVVVFDDEETPSGGGRPRRWREGGSDSGGAFLARLLQYLETPQYLRRALIPMHPDLRYAGLLPPLDAPHHARAFEWVPYREGCVVSSGREGEGEGEGEGEEQGSLVNVGITRDVHIRQTIPAGVRVTVAMGDDREAALQPGAGLSAVAPSEPRERRGLYWGFTVRLCKGLSQVLTDCPYPGGYDATLGTSEHGERVSGAALQLPPFRHLLIVFGGPAGLEESAELDNAIQVKETPCLFDRYLNTCPLQGSRTIRTEEAILISMSYLQDAIWRATGQNPFQSQC